MKRYKREIETNGEEREDKERKNRGRKKEVKKEQQEITVNKEENKKK